MLFPFAYLPGRDAACMQSSCSVSACNSFRGHMQSYHATFPPLSHRLPENDAREEQRPVLLLSPLVRCNIAHGSLNLFCCTNTKVRLYLDMFPRRTTSVLGRGREGDTNGMPCVYCAKAISPCRTAETGVCLFSMPPCPPPYPKLCMHGISFGMGYICACACACIRTYGYHSAGDLFHERWDRAH